MKEKIVTISIGILIGIVALVAIYFNAIRTRTIRSEISYLNALIQTGILPTPAQLSAQIKKESAPASSTQAPLPAK